ncbi:hypothetical protein BACCAP_01994 [Pseudoflavonifractor capillosus ATCC 29799]|uniref:Uncharacterized protein n=1 Tax=Pseudoflavonifractor capillosus ATCC 29799 TaxID=411467 RepID=A6NUW1_9FIRM|nr:hypothetical protein BACCAP_01994 [Pseudoflavonifractor capillosus ATCC 29799]
MSSFHLPFQKPPAPAPRFGGCRAICSYGGAFRRQALCYGRRISGTFLFKVYQICSKRASKAV